jgi:hypothetical protein
MWWKFNSAEAKDSSRGEGKFDEGEGFNLWHIVMKGRK